jgi:hypothetical protein
MHSLSIFAPTFEMTLRLLGEGWLAERVGDVVVKVVIEDAENIVDKKLVFLRLGLCLVFGLLCFTSFLIPTTILYYVP